MPPRATNFRMRKRFPSRSPGENVGEKRRPVGANVGTVAISTNPGREIFSSSRLGGSDRFAAGSSIFFLVSAQIMSQDCYFSFTFWSELLGLRRYLGSRFPLLQAQRGSRLGIDRLSGSHNGSHPKAFA